MDADHRPVDVSIIIVSWNAREYLKNCLASIARQDFGYAVETIVVDNCSSDGSADCVASDFPGVRLIRNRHNDGFARANNIGCAVATGQYLCFINSDVVVLPHCIDRLVDHCEADARAGMVGPLILGSDGQLQRSCRGFPSLWNMLCRALALDTAFAATRLFTGYSLRHWPQDEQRSVDILTGCFWLVRRQALEQVGLLDEDFFIYGEDMDWCRRFWSAGWQVVFAPQARAIHHGGASSANAPIRFFIERQKADLHYWRKHHHGVAVAGYLAITLLHLTIRVMAGAAWLLIQPGRPARWFKVRRSLACLGWLLSNSWQMAASRPAQRSSP
jgi:GT2 family glycosyltransferase